jgi:Tfp pilus assembly protein PilF
VSRLLDLLRRPRREGPPSGDGDGRTPGREIDRQNPPTPVGRAILLDVLSGATQGVAWYRRRVTHVLCVLGLAAIACYVIAAALGSRSGSTSRQALAALAPSSDKAPAPMGRQTGSPGAAPVEGRTPGPSPQRAPGPVGAQGDVTGARAIRPANAARPPENAEATNQTPTAGAVAPDSPAGETTREDENFTRALRYQQSGDVEHAIAEYRALLQVNDSNAQAHNNLGLLYQGKGLMEEAIGEFRRAVAIDPAYAKARNNLGVSLMRAGNLEAAAGEFRRVLSADPRNQDAMINLALSQRAAGRRDEARETLIRAIEINDRSAVAHYNLALLCEDAGDLARALDHYDAYMKYAAGNNASEIAAVRDHCQALRQRLIK